MGLKHLNFFWKIGRDDYLLSMRENKLKESRVQSPYTAKVGGVILIKDDELEEAGKWGICTSLYHEGTDKYVQPEFNFPQRGF